MHVVCIKIRIVLMILSYWLSKMRAKHMPLSTSAGWMGPLPGPLFRPRPAFRAVLKALRCWAKKDAKLSLLMITKGLSLRLHLSTGVAGTRWLTCHISNHTTLERKGRGEECVTTRYVNRKQQLKDFGFPREHTPVLLSAPEYRLAEGRYNIVSTI